MNISEDKIFGDVLQSARDSAGAVLMAQQIKEDIKSSKEEIKQFIRNEVFGVKESIFQDRDRYFEKKDKPVLEAIEKISEKLDEIYTWKVAADGDIKKAKWGLRAIFLSVCGYFGINVKGL